MDDLKSLIVNVLLETSRHDPNDFNHIHPALKSKYPRLSAKIDGDIESREVDVDNQHAALMKHLYVPEHARFSGESALGKYVYDGEYSRKLNKILARTYAVEGSSRHRIPYEMEAAHSGAPPLPFAIHTYSGLSDWKPSGEIGDKIHTPAYTSTSLNPETSLSFAQAHHDEVLGKHVLHFALPKGYNKGLYIPAHDENRDVFGGGGEHEYLLDAGQNWEITHKHTHNRIQFLGSGMRRILPIHIWSLKPAD